MNPSFFNKIEKLLKCFFFLRLSSVEGSLMIIEYYIYKTTKQARIYISILSNYAIFNSAKVYIFDQSLNSHSLY